MEDVWEDLSLSSLQYYSPSTATPHHGVNLQDFLSRPGPPAARERGRGRRGATLFGCHTPPPPTVLSLDRTRPHPQTVVKSTARANTDVTGSIFPPEVLSSPNSCSITSTTTAMFPNSFCPKRASENIDDSSSEKHKRLMKNRESADRSRARKQAYTTQLESEVTRLLEENARLRLQLQTFRSAAASSAQLPKKQTLHRTSTAPF